MKNCEVFWINALVLRTSAKSPPDRAGNRGALTLAARGGGAQEAGSLILEHGGHAPYGGHG